MSNTSLYNPLTPALSLRERGFSVRCYLLIILLGSMLWTIESQAGAGNTTGGLRHNPFHKPLSVLEQPPEEKSKDEPEPDLSELRLRATLVSAELPMAIVNDVAVAVGEDIHGYRLHSVKEGQALFIRQGKKYTLDINHEKMDAKR